MVQVGDTIKDNDPRGPNRMLVIVAFDSPGYVRAARHPAAKRQSRIALKRIFDDGKTRRHGWNVVKP
jgi:hypothetical protein